MSYFERTEGAEDNLGNNPKFKSLEELAVDPNLKPDEYEDVEDGEELAVDSDLKPDEFEDLEEDDLPSNWEEDVERGKYDEYKTEKSVDSVEIKPIHTKNRINVAEIENMKGMEQMEKYWDVPRSSEAKNSKSNRPHNDRDSIRFDEAV